MPDTPPSRNAPYIEEFRANEGRLGGNFEGVPVLLLHVQSADGDPVIVPLTCQPLDGAWAIFASKGGATTEPAWLRTLLANPDTTIEFGPDTIPVWARLTTGSERDEIWTRQKTLMPAFAAYERTADRTIPVILLEPREPSA